MDRKRLFNIFLIVLIDILGFGLIVPLLPYYADTFGANATITGLLVASYAAMQIIGAPILGRLSDQYGRRPILLVSIFGTLLGYILLGFANALWMLFAARMLDGLTGGNISVAQAYIADASDEKNRARSLGLIGAAFGLGFVVGPMMGGLLSKLSFAAPAIAAASLASLNLLTVFLWLPESLTAERRAELADKPRQLGLNLQALTHAFARPQVATLLNVRLGFALAFNTFQTIFPLYALERFQLEADQTAYILAYIGVLVVLVQGAAIGPLTARYNEKVLIFTAVSLTGIALLGWAFSPTIPALLVALAPMALGAGIFNTVINSSLSKAVPPQEVGEILGLSASLESLTRVISPAMSGFLLGNFGPAIPGLVGAAISGCLLPYVWVKLLRIRP